MLALSLLICSCSAPSELEPFSKAVSEFSARAARIETELVTEAFGTLASSYDVEYDGATAKVKYSRVSLSTVTPSLDPDKLVSTSTGEVTIERDGSSDKLGALVSRMVFCRLVLDEDLIEYRIEGDALHFTVKADKVGEVLGASVGCDADVTLTLSEDRIASLTVVYETAVGTAKLTADFE